MPKQLYKRYVEVVVRVDKEGNSIPLFLLWEGSHGVVKFKVDKIITIRESFSVVGGGGLQYQCQIEGKRRNLYLEKGTRWFIESEKP